MAEHRDVIAVFGLTVSGLSLAAILAFLVWLATGDNRWGTMSIWLTVAAVAVLLVAISLRSLGGT